MRRLLWALGLAVLSCGGDGGTGPAIVASMEVTPGSWLAVGVEDTVRFHASAVDASQRPVADAHPTWTVDDTAIASVDDTGLATARGAGVTRVVARVGEVAADALLEIYLPPQIESYQPGVPYLGRRGYVEYVPGTLPLVISVPHGGDLEPAEIPDRTYGETVTDSWTRETAQAVREAFVARTGRAPHVVVSHLRRTKLDPNREIVEAAQGSPFAENAWNEFQGFIDIAEATVEDEFGSGFYIDVHGHGHEVLRAELGYLLSASDLDGSDAALDAGGYAERSSLRAIAGATDASFSELLRGETSLGGLLAVRGVAAVPSPPDPSPGTAPYFTGGYDVDRHGSRVSGAVSGVQMELPRAGTRDTDENRRAFARALAEAVEAFMTAHWGFFAP
jgi:hypothetical protein